MMRAALFFCIALLGACSQPQAPRVLVLPPDAGPGSAEPNLYVAADGTTLLSWLEPLGEGVALRYATLQGKAWSGPVTVAAGDNWFVNWADFPSVVKIDSKLWAAHWLVKRPGGTFAYDVSISLSNDGGQRWSEAITPHTDGTATEHGFVSLFPWQDGVGALWLDGRDTNGHGEGGMALRSAVLDASGQTVFEQLADELVCDCCQTDVAVSSEGPVAVYRNRSRGEIRDIHVMRGDTDRWQQGLAVADDGWEIAGCPVNGPAISAAGTDVAVAWFTAAGQLPKVRLARSSDGARTFEVPVDVTTRATAGRVGVAILGGSRVAVSWLRPVAGGSAEIVLSIVAPDGRIESETVVATTASGRLSGFPQLARSGDELVVAWTDTLGDRSRVRSALVLLE